MVVLVLAVAVGVTAYVGWLMWNAPESTPTTPAAASGSRRRQVQRREMKQRLDAVMRERPLRT